MQVCFNDCSEKKLQFECKLKYPLLGKFGMDAVRRPINDSRQSFKKETGGSVHITKFYIFFACNKAEMSIKLIRCTSAQDGYQ